MRISDWSSDVCSSDLGADDRARLLGVVHHRHQQGAKPEVEILLDDLGPSCQRAGDRLDRIGGDRLDLRQQRLHGVGRSEEHTSELQSLMRISYAVFCLKKKKQKTAD